MPGHLFYFCCRRPDDMELQSYEVPADRCLGAITQDSIVDVLTWNHQIPKTEGPSVNSIPVVDHHSPSAAHRRLIVALLLLWFQKGKDETRTRKTSSRSFLGKAVTYFISNHPPLHPPINMHLCALVDIGVATCIIREHLCT